MILSGLKQIFKLATCSTHAVLLILKCSGKGMYGSIFLSCEEDHF